MKSQSSQIQFRNQDGQKLTKNVKVFKISSDFFDKLPKKMKINLDSEKGFKTAIRNQTNLLQILQ